jgi:acetyl-CoA carboxylase biotin carboxyl carrier protein
MDFKQIQELIKMINKSNIGEVTIEEKGFKITVKQKEEHIQQVIAAPYPTQVAPVASSLTSGTAAAENTSASPKSKSAEQSVSDNLITIKSPMIGTFYRSSGPDKSPFVNVGDETEPGKVVCIIEAMKLFNEIESEVKGRIVKVLVEDASPVEFDQPLFLVDPS